MALSFLLLLCLAVFALAWPQLPADDGTFGLSMTLPVPVTGGRGDQRDGDASRRQLPVDDDDDDTGTFYTLPIIHSTKCGVFSRQIEVELANRSDVAYYAQLNIGTPPQPVYAQLDTGSFELWVNPDCTVLRPADERFCQAVGVYDPGRSSSSSLLPSTASLRYGIGTANINYVRDDVSFAGSPVLSLVRFGMATATTDQFAGILGLGHGQNYTVTYPNIMDELVAQGAIRTKAYSLALGSKTEQQGLLVLGGIDTAKYSGHLAALPVIPAEQAPDRVARFWVNLKSLALTPPSGVTRAPYVAAAGLPVFLDSGATMTLLPRALADAVAADFGAPPSSSSADPEASHSFYEVDCSMADAPGTLDFSFGGSLTIRVPYAEMVRRTRADPPRCVLGFVPDDDFALLGDTFLRSAYAVFDLESDVVYMAQYQNCGERQMAVRRVQDIHAIVGLCEAPATGAAPVGKPALPSQAVAAPDTTPAEDATFVAGPAAGVVGVSAAAGLSLSRAWVWSIAVAMVLFHVA
ncbi:Candidapepsin-2 like protein [Verticillium longisporum]|uniref:Candidapepsin-2 like protein n=1 Tax=Verticillium longisporum TaxID=100787 RepID=A0A8I3A1T8_VERLO|nr:Candidapepsin-2 like protein [Verticillium longisporum]